MFAEPELLNIQTFILVLPGANLELFWRRTKQTGGTQTGFVPNYTDLVTVWLGFGCSVVVEPEIGHGARPDVRAEGTMKHMGQFLKYLLKSEV